MHRARRLLCLLPLLSALALAPVSAAAQTFASRFFTTSDGVRLHYIEAGAGNPRTIVFVPGWTMPGWIFEPQLAFFARTYHVVAFDPRGQGDSDVPAAGYEPSRRGQDIAELIAALGNRPVLIVGWSLGVLDTLAYVHAQGDSRVAGLVLVDNSVGEEPAPPPRRPTPHRGRPVPHDAFMRGFVRSMFRKPQSEEYLDELTQAALRTPAFAASALLAYPVPRAYWRDALYSTAKPVLYAVRPGLTGQAENLERRHPSARSVIFTDAGHALFIDDALRFNTLMADFIRTRVWP
jgi:microsomal epoxide hydrolase